MVYGSRWWLRRVGIFAQSQSISPLGTTLRINYKEKDNNLTMKVLTGSLLWARGTSLGLRHEPCRGRTASSSPATKKH